MVQQESGRQAAERATELMDHINSGIKAIEESSREASLRLDSTMEKLTDQMKSMASNYSTGSTQHSATLDNVLGLITKRVTENPHAQREEGQCSIQAQLSKCTERDDDTQDAPSDDAELQDALTRLCQLAEEEDQMMMSIEAEILIAAIESIFFTPSKAHKSKRDPLHISKKRIRPNLDDEDVQFGREMKRVKGLLTASQAVAVNRKGS